MKMSNKGFTLVEIMIVVAIIGLLAAIAIPNFVRARTTAQTNACIGNLRQIDGAKQVWAIEQQQTDSVTPTMATLSPNYIKREPRCPAGSSTAYTVNSVSVLPLCPNSATQTAHKL